MNLSIEERILAFSDRYCIAPYQFLLPRTQNYDTNGLTILDKIASYGRDEFDQFTTISTIVEANKVHGTSTLKNIKTIYDLIIKDYIYMVNNENLLRVIFDIYVSNGNKTHLYTSSDVKDLENLSRFLGIPQTQIKKGEEFSIIYRASELKTSITIYEGLNKIFSTMEDLQDLNSSSAKYSVSQVRKILNNDNTPLNLTQIVDLFNILFPTKEYPYIVYKHNKIIYKILNNHRPPEVDNPEEGILYCGEGIKIVMANSSILYNRRFDVNALVETLITNNYKVDAVGTISYEVELKIEGEIVDPHIFQDMILIDDNLVYYTITKESSYKSGDINKIKMMYKGIRTNVPGISPRKQQNIRFFLQNSIRLDNHNRRNVVIITSEEIISPSLIDEFINNVGKLVAYYKKNSRPLINEYINYFGANLVNVRVEMTNLQILRSSKSKYFDSEYSSNCVGPGKQPKYISKEDYNTIDNKTRDLVAMELLDPLKLEDGNPNPIYITCEYHEDNKYIYLKDGKIPCCKKSINNIKEKKEKQFSTKRSQLPPGNTIHIPGLGDVFGETRSNNSVSRVGVEQGSNSFYNAITACGVVVSDVGQIGAYKQSMYDMSDKEIRDYFTLKNWDSDLIADGISLNTRTNIVIVYTHEKETMFRLPRYSYLYYRTFYSSYPTIIIYRYQYLDKINYEPVSHNGNMIFGPNLQVCNNIYKKFESYYGVQSIGNVISETLFQYIPTPLKIETQIIDSRGKMCGFVSKGYHLIYNYRKEPIARPYINSYDVVESTNIPTTGGTIQKSHLLLRNNDGDLIWSDVPTSYVSNKTGNIINIAHQESVIIKSNQSEILRNILLQYLSWIFILHFHDKIKNKFIKYMKVDPLTNYVFSNKNDELLPSMTFHKAMDHVVQFGMSKNGVLIFPTRHVMDGCIQFIKFITMVSDIRVPTTVFIPAEYMSNVKSIVLDGDVEKNKYEKALNFIEEGPIISLEKKIFLSKAPVAITTSEGVNYILQNVNEIDSYSRACNCVIQWNYKKINTGYDTSVMESTTTKTASLYVGVYTITDSMILVPMGNESDMKILSRGPKGKEIYSALLTI